MLTRERLVELLHYNSITGIFTWQKSRGRASALSPAGTEDNLGYIRLRVDGKKYRAHRLAFLYMEGEFPPEDVDHINGIRHDNRWSNLRACSRTENMYNTSAHRDSAVGVKGVSWDKWSGKYTARISINGRLTNLGRFPSLDEAKKAYDRAAQQLHGEFYRAS